MNDSDDAALGDRMPTEEDEAEIREYEADQAEQEGGAAMPLDPRDGIHDYRLGAESGTTAYDGAQEGYDAAAWAEAEEMGAQGGGPHDSDALHINGLTRPHPPGDGMPPLAVWPGHEDCDPRGRVHDDVEGWVCSCGEVLGELPDAGEVADAVARFGQDSQPAEVQGRDPIVTVVPALELDQITPSEIERQLASIMARLELGSHFQRQVEVRAFTLRQDYDVATAKTITRLVEDGVKGDAAYRKSAALVENEQLFRDTMEAEELRRCVRETMHNLRSMQTGFQTIARSVGVSFGSPAQGQGGYARGGF